MKKQTFIPLLFLSIVLYNPVSSLVYAFPSDRPSLKTLANCGKLINFYVSQEGWQVSNFSSCLRTPSGGNYTFSSATKDKQSILWTSEGGNKWRDYTVISTNLLTRSYVQYKAFLGINGGGTINSMQIEDWNGKNVIPIVNILTVLEWEREFYKPASPFRNDKCFAAIKLANKQIEEDKEINLRSYVHATSFRRPNYLENKPLEYIFSIQGISAKDIIRSTSLLSSISSILINSCPSISVVNFGVHNTDWVVTYGLFENGAVKQFQCTEIRKLGQEVAWGYKECF
jgi:hypothetical protein